MEALLVLPNPINGFSPHLIRSLDEHFKTQEDLCNAQSLSTEIKKDYGDLDRKLTTLQKSLSSLIAQWGSRSNSIRTLLRQLHHKFQGFGVDSSSDVIGKVGSNKNWKVLGEELSILAKELRRIETIRGYVETTLRLEVLVGDLEDAVLCVLNQKTSNLNNFRWKQEKLNLCLRAMNDMEDILVNVSKNHLKWSNLLKSVDGRVDKPLGSLRLQALADHKVLLNSIGWPPPLSTSEGEGEKGSELLNPLVLIKGENKERYSQIFLALCSLQHLHNRRDERKGFDVLGKSRDHRYGLWPIDELVSPIALKVEHHFSKWFDKPKFIFALVYKITRDLVVGVDDVLQPLIDKARLVGCSAREDWVSAMAEMLSTYLKKRVFSVLVNRYRDTNRKAEIIYSWLHLVDLIIAFDKRMHTPADLGTAHFSGESVRFSKETSVLSIFCDHPDWMRIWAKLELKDALKKLSSELENPGAWMINNNVGSYKESEPEPFIFSSREDHKAPLIAEAAVKITQTMIERCQTLPSILLRIEFIRLSSVRFLWHFFNILLQRCTETVYMASYAEDDATVKICESVNAARYCESILREWSEDVNFMEMRMAEDDLNTQLKSDQDDHCCFFWEEVKFLMKLQTDWIVEIMADLLRQFDTFSQRYVQNKEHWGWKLEGSVTNSLLGTSSSVSTDFVEALDALRNWLRILKRRLNSKDFLYLWRSIADGLDQFIFSSIVMSGATFSDWGVNQFSTDMQALFLVFQPFCVRPEAFFPCIRDSLKLFKMDLEDAKHLQSILAKGVKKLEKLQFSGILYISPDQTEKLLRRRKYGL